MKDCIVGRPSAWKNCLPRFGGALMALGLSMAPSLGQAACKLQSLELPVTLVGQRAIATLGLNGTNARMIVDSGGFYSMLTTAAAQQLELETRSLPWGLKIQGLTGGIEARVATVKRLQLRDGELPNVDFIIGGNDDGNGTLGLLGRNILSLADTEYDLAHGVVRLVFPDDGCANTNMAYWAGDQAVVELPLVHDNLTKLPAIETYAKINGKEIRVLFDTGAQTVVALDAAKRAGASDMTAAGQVNGAGSGSAQAWTAKFSRFELGGEAISNIRLTVANFDIQADMLVGVDFFLSHRIYISQKQHRMYFTYNGGPIFALTAQDIAKVQAANPSAAASAPQLVDADEPTDAAGYARRGAASAARLDFARALADLDRACQMAPQLADYFVRRAAVHTTMEHEQLAMKDLDTALQLDPAHAEARIRRAWLRDAAENRDGAIEDLQALDKLLVPQAHERLEMAMLYEKLGIEERALPLMNQWIAAHPKDMALSGALNNRCWARTMLNIELDQALADCDKAIDLQPAEAAFYDSRGWLQVRRSELRKARSDFDRALKLQPDGAWSLYGRGIVRRKLGEAQAGQADLEAARKLLPSIDTQTLRHGLAAADNNKEEVR